MVINKLSILFSILLSMFSANASAYDIKVKNADGVTIYYNYINNKTELEVTAKSTEINEIANSYSGSIVIPEEVTYENRTLKVTSISISAFLSCKSLTSVTIPDGVKSIGQGAFLNCKNLTSINIPESVTSIGKAAFQDCSALTSITIPSNITILGTGVFGSCSGLTSITIPNSVKSIEHGTFANCTGLTSITIPNSVTSIGNSAFAGWEKSNISKVISKIENPFALGMNSFSDETYSKATLYVPKGTISKYKATEGWKKFANIQEEN